MTAQAQNYDSKGLQTGLSVGDILSGFELQLIANRKQLFKNALSSSNGFNNAVLYQLGAYDNAIDTAAASVFKSITESVTQEFKRTYNTGKSEIQKSIKQLGVKIERQQSFAQTALTYAIAGTLANFATVLYETKVNAKNQLLSINSALLGQDNITAQKIDTVQLPYVAQGITVSRGGGNQKTIESYGEYVVRNDSQSLLLQAKGEESASYGISRALISAHPSSCPLCVPWQNKVVINDLFAGGKPDGRTPLMSEAKEAGLFHFNCRHSYTTYVPGESNKNLYKKDTASVRETAKRYAVEQQSRYNEAGIRSWKIRAESALSDKEQLTAQAKIKEWQQKQTVLRSIANEQGVPFYRQYEREQIGGQTRPSNTLISLYRKI